MNKKNIERWEIRLGVAQVVIILGVITGCMTFAFYLGFFSGKSAGFDIAMSSNGAQSAKLPISGESVGDKASVDITEQAVSDVYARLNEKTKQDQESEVGALDDVPALGSIKESDPLPFERTEIQVPDPKVVEKTSDEAAKLFELDEEPKSPQADVKVLGDDLPSARNSKAAVLADAKKDTHPIDKALDEANAPKKLLKDEKLVAIKSEKEAKKEKEIVKPTATVVPPTPTPKKVEAKKEEPKQVAKKNDEGATITRGVIPKGWFAQVAAPTKRSEADGIAEKLKKNGFRVVIESAKVRGDEYYRILVGPEENKKQAELLVQQLKRESYLGGSPFIRMVK